MHDLGISCWPVQLNNILFSRFAVCASKTESHDIEFGFKTIQDLTTKLLAEDNNES